MNPLSKYSKGLGLFAVHQAFYSLADVMAGLQGGGAESRQQSAGLPVGHGSYVTDGEDTRMIFQLEVRTNGNASAMHQFHTQ